MPLVATLTIPADPRALTAHLLGLWAENVLLMRTALARGGSVARLYESGVKYRPEGRDPRTGKPREEWLDWAQVMKRRVADCEDLAGARAAELTVLDGVLAIPVVRQNPSGSFHAIVRYASGILEDPSRILIALERKRRCR
jgi:hypothetical protein